MQKNTQKKIPTSKNNVNCIVFAFFAGGFVRASNFSKIAKHLGKMQKQANTNAKNMRNKCKKCETNAKKIQKTCKFWKCACFTKTNFQKLHFFAFLIACFLHFFLHFPGPRFLRLHFLGAFFCNLIKFYNLKNKLDFTS